MLLPLISLLNLVSSVLTAPVVVSVGSGIATVRVTTDTAPSVSRPLAALVRLASAPVASAAAILASPTQTITSGLAGARDFSLSALLNGTEYAVDFAQPGSNVVSTVAFRPSTVPDAPVIGVAIPGNAEARVTGSAPPSDGGLPILEYLSTSTPPSASILSATLPITHTGLANETPYTFTLSARNANGWGPPSVASNSVTPSVSAPPLSPYLAQPQTSSSWSYRQTATLWRLVSRDNWGGQTAHERAGLFLCDYKLDDGQANTARGSEYVSRLTVFTSLPGVRRGDMIKVGVSEVADPYAAGALEVLDATAFADTFRAEGPQDFRILT